MKCKNLFWVHNISNIGGLETYLNEIVNKYSPDYDITVLYRSADAKQICRLSEKVKCAKWDGKEVECDVAVLNYDVDFAEHIKANKIYAIIHADYVKAKMKPKLSPKVDKYFAVSQIAADSFKKITGIECEVFPNPLTMPKPKKVLHLLSCTRLNKAKGEDRMVKLADELTRRGIPFIWNVFCDYPKNLHPNICCLPPRFDVRDYIADADFVVQLSDSEARSYTVAEALAYGTPVIVTEHPSFAQQGVVDGVNGYILPYDMSKIPNIKPLKFEPILTDDRYAEILIKSKSKYKTYKVKALKDFTKIYDSQYGKYHSEGEIFTVSEDRYDELTNNKFNKKLVEKVK